MYRFWNLSLMICFSVSVMFVGSENTSELPPPKNLNFKWETPFSLSLSWEKPEDLDHTCKVNYTVRVHKSQDCSSKDTKTKCFKVSQLSLKVNVSNENGLCISVSTNLEHCENRDHSRSTNIILSPPPATLVTERGYAYSHDTMKCTWKPSEDVQDLGFYYWLSMSESIIKCIPDEKMKTGECMIHNKDLRNTMEIYYLFNGTLNGIPVNNTFEDYPLQHVKLQKPVLKIHRIGQKLHFETNDSDVKDFADHCYEYKYKYSKCNEILNISGEMIHSMEYDPACKYRASVQVILKTCGSGYSDPSDEVEYGKNSNPSLPALLAVIIIPLVVSCCLVVSLLLFKRHKNIIFPNIPKPTDFFKDMFNNNITTTGERSSTNENLYSPTVEILETRISVDTPFVQSTNNVQHEPE